MGDPVNRNAAPSGSLTPAGPPPADRTSRANAPARGDAARPATAPVRNTNATGGATPAATGPAPAGAGIANIRVAPAPAGPARPQPAAGIFARGRISGEQVGNLLRLLQETRPVPGVASGETTEQSRRRMEFEAAMIPVLIELGTTGSLRHARSLFRSSVEMYWSDVPGPDSAPPANSFAINTAAKFVETIRKQLGESDERFRKINDSEDAGPLIRDIAYYYTRTRCLKSLQDAHDVILILYLIVSSLDLTESGGEKTAPASAQNQKTGEK